LGGFLVKFEPKFDDCGAGGLISIYGSKFSLNLSGKFDVASQPDVNFAKIRVNLAGNGSKI